MCLAVNNDALKPIEQRDFPEVEEAHGHSAQKGGGRKEGGRGCWLVWNGASGLLLIDNSLGNCHLVPLVALSIQQNQYHIIHTSFT